MDDATRAKRCCRCATWLPVESFHTDRSRKDGRCPDCKSCRLATNAKGKARLKAQRAERRAALLTSPPRSKACKVCLEDKPLTQFVVNSRLRWGRGERCKTCHNAASRASFKDDQRRRELAAESYRRWRARKLAATVAPISSAQINARMSMFGYKCWMCGGPFEHVDHVKPLSKGGLHMLCNLRPACGSCNRSKAARWPFHATPRDTANATVGVPVPPIVQATRQ